jgi:hypothetical protein
VLILIGEPLRPAPDADPEKVTAELRTRIQELLDRAQNDYPDKPVQDAWWVPQHLGGTAPTPEEAAVLDAGKA